MSEERKTIPELLEDWTYDIEGPLQDFISTLQKCQNKYKSDYLRLELSWDDYGYGSSSKSVILYGHRLETDDEYEMRLATEKQTREAREKTRREQYEKLKVEFDKG